MRYLKRTLLASLVLASLIIFVPHLRLAFTIGTGIGLNSLQKQIEATQSRAIKGKITEDDREFLVRFYRTMAYGAQATFVLPESARLMHHYLDGSGAATSIDKSLYIESTRVIAKMNAIRKHLRANCENGTSLTSKRFDMGHGYPLDAHYSLYFGTISGTVIQKGGQKNIRWDVEMPWNWRTYADIKAIYGSYKREIFPFPNALSLLGLGEPMWLPNGLGGELALQNLAKAFDVNTTWSEKFTC